jgi:TPP-dependent pyruvate/acetoin dehydrogenase alpha subunit
MYKDMQAMHRMGMAADALYKAKLARVFCHLAIGQVRQISHFLLCCHRSDGRGCIHRRLF